MGWWIFKSAKEKQLSNIGKRLKNLEDMIYEERENEILDALDARLERIEKTMTEEEPTTEPTTEKEKALADLSVKAATVRQVWAKVPAWIRPIANDLCRQQLGKTVDEILQDSKAVEQGFDMLAGAATGLLTKAKQSITPSDMKDVKVSDYEKPMPTGYPEGIMDARQRRGQPPQES